MYRFKRMVPLMALLALAAIQTAGRAHAQQPPPDNGGGPGGGPGGAGNGFGGGGPPDGGPPDPAEFRRHLVDRIERQMNVTATTFAALKPDIDKILSLREAVEGSGHPGPPDGGPGGDDNGPPDMNGGGGGGGGPGGDPTGGGGNQDAGGQGGGGNGSRTETTTSRRHRRGQSGTTFTQVGGDTTKTGTIEAGGTPSTDDPTAVDLVDKVRTLRLTLRQTEDDDAAAGDAAVATEVKDVRAARAKAVAELAKARKDLKGLVHSSAHADAVLVAAGVLD